MTDTTATPLAHPIEVRTIGTSDLRDSLVRGWSDFRARPTTAIFLIVVYPFVGLVLYRFAFDRDLLPLLFPMASGFALIGPLAATGVYEISRRREQGGELDGVSSFQALGRGRLVPVLLVGCALLGLYLVWIGAAQTIWQAIMGDFEPESLPALAAEVLGTGRGWALIIVGCGVGFLFAVAALAIGAISLPAIVDRGIGALDAVNLSVRALVANPATMLAWGFLVAAALVAASIPLFLGLLVALPVFGHASWHLYRRLAPKP